MTTMEATAVTTDNIRWARGAATGNRANRPAVPPWHAVDRHDQHLIYRTTACHRRLRAHEVERGSVPPTDGRVCPECAIAIARQLDKAGDTDTAMDLGLVAVRALLAYYVRMNATAAAYRVTNNGAGEQVTTFTTMTLANRYYAAGSPHTRPARP